MVCNQSKNDWSFLVDSVVFAYNISVNETTGYSPFYLTTGRHPNLPISVLTGLRSKSIKHRGHPFVERMTTALNDAYRIVRTRQLRTLERNKRYQLGLTASATDEQVRAALEKRPIPGFRVGELVSYWEPEIKDKDIEHVMPKKFQYRWNGPFAIGEREGKKLLCDDQGCENLGQPRKITEVLHVD